MHFLSYLQICREFQSYLDEGQLNLDYILDDNEEYCTLLANLVHDNTGIPGKVLKVKCAAHTLQLIICKGINNSNVLKLIDICRNAVKMLRTTKLIDEAREKGLIHIRPRCDCLTRWNSTFLMVNY
jgi:hypothetical protein